MSQPKPGPEPALKCWECGAVNDVGSSECWLCQRRDWRRNTGAGPNETVATRMTLVGPAGSTAGLMVLFAVIAVLFGLFVFAPGLAIALLVGALPALAITEAKANRRRERGEAMSGTARFLWIVGLMMVIPFALIAAFLVALFVDFSGAGREADPAAVILILLIAAFLVFLIIAIVFARSRRTERSSTTDDD